MRVYDKHVELLAKNLNIDKIEGPSQLYLKGQS